MADGNESRDPFCTSVPQPHVRMMMMYCKTNFAPFKASLNQVIHCGAAQKQCVKTAFYTQLHAALSCTVLCHVCFSALQVELHTARFTLHTAPEINSPHCTALLWIAILFLQQILYRSITWSRSSTTARSWNNCGQGKKLIEKRGRSSSSPSSAIYPVIIQGTFFPLSIFIPGVLTSPMREGGRE